MTGGFTKRANLKRSWQALRSQIKMLKCHTRDFGLPAGRSQRPILLVSPYADSHLTTLHPALQLMCAPLPE